jgi:cytochrome c oxidase assembly factor CtaG
MNPDAEGGGVALAIAMDWVPDPLIPIGLLVSLAIYLRGWASLHRQAPEHFGTGRLVAFAAGLLTIGLAIGSPLDAFADQLLQAHMVQHWLLMMVAPPLLWLGSPQIAMLRGLPASWRRIGLGPFLAWPALQRLQRFVTHPLFAWPAFVGSTWIWHTPKLYELALSSRGWHQTEHVFFLGTALLFWWPVIQPWPSRGAWPRWAMIPYLLLAAVQNTLFAALFTFSDQVFYPRYNAVPSLFGNTALADQSAAGAFLWVASGLVLLPTVALLVVRLLGPAAAPPTRTRRPRLPTHTTFDALRIPLLGKLLRSGAFRRTLQLACFGVALAVILDGFVGPQASAASNLAGVLPWTWWRGLVVLGLFAAGSLFCMACPFTLSRGIAKRLLGAQRSWPAALRNKWLAAGLLVAFFAGVEGLGVWSSPAATAWLLVAYFVFAFVLDGLFEGAVFCKYVCPAGQFQFTQAALSPLEVQALDDETCRDCRTTDCLRGNASRPGCATDLLMPAKRGNWDCTLCLDCVRACPHDNIGLIAVTPGRDLLGDPPRSSLGRLSTRLDVAAITWILFVAAFANAAAMAAPVAGFFQGFVQPSGSPGTSAGIATAAALVGIPLLGLVGLGRASRFLGKMRAPWSEIAARHSLALLPLGFSMWLAHYGLHLYTGWRSAGTAIERVALDLRSETVAPSIDWSMAMAQGGTPGLLSLEIGILGLGLVGSLYAHWRIARSLQPLAGPAARSALVWGTFCLAFYCFGVWVLAQPMMMRGTLL